MSNNTLSLAIIGLLALGGLVGGGSEAPGASPAPPPQVEAPSDDGELVEIRSDEVWVRDTPGGTGKVASLTRGSRVTQLGQSGSWVRVRLGDGREGWISHLVIGAPSLDSVQSSGDVWAYYVEDRAHSSWPSFDMNADRLTGVIPWSFTVDGSGRLQLAEQLSEARLAAVLQRAGRANLETHLLVQNFRNGRFDQQLVHELLSDPQARRRAAEAMAAQARAWGARGIHLDLENVPPLDRSSLTTFVAELSARLHQEGLELSMALPAKTVDRATHAWSGAFDYPALVPHLDRAVLMTYDQHSRNGPPGPVAAAPWVEEVVQYALSTGFAPGQLLLGVAGYGYDWPASGTARSLTHAQVMNLLDQQYGLAAESALRWDRVARSPHFAYGAGNQVWFENKESLAYKLEIAGRYGLRGVALWRLGQEDPGSWTLLAGN